MFNIFKQPTPAQYAARSLREAEMLLLKAYADLEYVESIVSQRTAQINRLEKFLADTEAKKAQETSAGESKTLSRVLSVFKAPQTVNKTTTEIKNVVA